MLEYVLTQLNKPELTSTNALLYCQFFRYNDHNDWRLPTQKELSFIIKMNPQINPIILERCWDAEHCSLVIVDDNSRFKWRTRRLLPVRESK